MSLHTTLFWCHDPFRPLLFLRFVDVLFFKCIIRNVCDKMSSFYAAHKSAFVDLAKENFLWLCVGQNKPI